LKSSKRGKKMPEDPFTDFTNFNIRLIRDKVDSDDTLTIKKVREDIYVVYYTHSTNKDEKQITILNKEQVLTYIQSIFFLIAQDRTAFRFVQLNIPYVPLLMIPAAEFKEKKLRNAIKTICDAVYF
jgi:hypothetical protein